MGEIVKCIEPKDASWLTGLVQHVVRDELSSVQSAIMGLRAELRLGLGADSPGHPLAVGASAPPPSVEAECRRCLPPGKASLAQPQAPQHEPSALPGVSHEEDCGGPTSRTSARARCLGARSNPDARTSAKHVALPGSADDVGFVSVGSDLSQGSASRSHPPARPRWSSPNTDCVEGDEGRVAKTVGALNFDSVQKRAQDVKRMQANLRRSKTMSFDDESDEAPILMTEFAQAFWRRISISRRRLDGPVLRRESFSGIATMSWVQLLSKRTRKVVQGHRFDMFVCVMLVVNAILIGVQANHKVANAEPSGSFRALEIMFCVLFTLELALRIFAYRLDFFKSGDLWNYFDFLLVFLQLADELTVAIAGAGQMQDVSVVRLVRVLRLLRILRLLRVVRFVAELRKVIYLIIGSLPSFGWTVVLLMLMVYILAVFLTQLVADSIGEWGSALGDEQQVLSNYFGSTMLSILTLYKTVSGGVDWEDISDPVISHLSPFAGVMIIIFNGFSVLVLLNLVTGVFVDGALRLSRADKEMELLEKAYKLFKKTDEDGSGDITWAEFQQRLSSPEMCEFFEALEISMTRADDLFELIDRSGDGKLSLEELVAGGLMLQGPATSMDVASLNNYLQVSIEGLRNEVLSLKHRPDLV